MRDSLGRIVPPNAGGRPCELGRPWCTLAADLGGVAELAHACGVSTRTIQRWAQGLRPSALVMAGVRRLFVQRRCLTSEPWPPPRKADVISIAAARARARRRRRRAERPQRKR